MFVLFGFHVPLSLQARLPASFVFFWIFCIVFWSLCWSSWVPSPASCSDGARRQGRSSTADAPTLSPPLRIVVYRCPGEDQARSTTSTRSSSDSGVCDLCFGCAHEGQCETFGPGPSVPWWLRVLLSFFFIWFLFYVMPELSKPLF
jgi:hypothetical protein